MFRKFLGLFFIILFGVLNCSAELIIDDSIHSKIVKDYELENLPDLPSNLQNSTVESIFTPNEFDTEPTSKYNPQNSENKTEPKTTPDAAAVSAPAKTNQVSPVQTTNNYSQTNKTYKAVTIKKGKKFRVTNSSALSDTTQKGTVVTFVSTNAETSRFVTVPKNTVFKGTIIDSHSPNLTGNGGLLVIKITQINYNGGWYPVNAKITLANQKKIFFNNIKGKRMYWKNVKQKTAFGKKTYDKMWKKTKKYFKPNIEIIISPITFITGTVVYAANAAVSPVLAIFTKGGKLSIPKNSVFEIKFLEDTVLYR